MPSSVTVPAGATQASFTVQAPAVSSNTGVTVFATLGAVTKSFALSLTAPNTTFTLGNTAQGTTAGRNDGNHITASRFIMPQGRSGSVSSMSVYIGSPVAAAPNNLFQVAIYSDNGGKPGVLLASSSSISMTANSWNTANISASLQAGAYYWLAYNTNATNNSSNNMALSQGGSTVAIQQTFGSWPANISSKARASNQSGSIYANLQ
jgi:hypothetical protein